MVRLRTALEPDRPAGSSGRYVVRRGTPATRWRWTATAARRAAFADLAARGRALLAAGDARRRVDAAARALDAVAG